MGTDDEEGIRFLSAEAEPMEVLQLAGMLLDGEGKILPAGAEGILLKDTPFSLQIIDSQKSSDDSAIRKLLAGKQKEDLPGRRLILYGFLYLAPSGIIA